MANIDKINGKCKIYFYSINGDCGHWVYCDSEGNIQNSYELKHQKRGSNQFCQSFALFYMLKDNYLKTIPELKDMINSINLKEDQFGYNIQQIIKMWKYFIFSNQYPNIKEWLIKSIKELNDEYIKSDPKFKININSTLIDSTLIESKLEFISINAELIALNT